MFSRVIFVKVKSCSVRMFSWVFCKVKTCSVRFLIYTNIFLKWRQLRFRKSRLGKSGVKLVKWIRHPTLNQRITGSNPTPDRIKNGKKYPWKKHRTNLNFNKNGKKTSRPWLDHPTMIRSSSWRSTVLEKPSPKPIIMIWLSSWNTVLEKQSPGLAKSVQEGFVHTFSSLGDFTTVWSNSKMFCTEYFWLGRGGINPFLVFV